MRRIAVLAMLAVLMTLPLPRGGRSSAELVLQSERRHLPEHEESRRHPLVTDRTGRQVLRPVHAVREGSRWLQGVSPLPDK